MKFVWDLDMDAWKKFSEAIKNGDFETAYKVGEDLGCCRTGDLCFDVTTWQPGEWTGWGFNLYCGGVDSGYGYSCHEAMETGKYKSKYDVPDELLYPYDYVDYGDFPLSFATTSLDEFKANAEIFFAATIARNEGFYLDQISLIDKANEPLHIW